MSRAQKQAWYGLIVVAASATAVAVLWALMGPAGQAGFGLLGLQGLTPWLFRERGQVVSHDERDAAIQRRSIVVAYAVFWVAFVLACVSLPLVYGWNGAVPVALVQLAVWVSWMLVSTVNSVATLVQYGRGVPDAA